MIDDETRLSREAFPFHSQINDGKHGVGLLGYFPHGQNSNSRGFAGANAAAWILPKS